MENTSSWPLSAAATKLLMEPRTPASTVLKLSIKELVVVGSLVLTPTMERRRFRGDARVIHLLPGDRPLPLRRPLPEVRAGLLKQCPEGGPLREVVAAAVKADRKLADDARAHAIQDLQARHLVVAEKKLFRTVHTRTPLGVQWLAEAMAKQVSWRSAVETGGPAATAAVAAAVPALVLLFDPSSLQAIDGEVRRATSGSDGGVVVVASDDNEDSVMWADLEAIDGLSGLDSAVDPGVDAGTSDGGGDGGDGGGGGD